MRWAACFAITEGSVAYEPVQRMSRNAQMAAATTSTPSNIADDVSRLLPRYAATANTGVCASPAMTIAAMAPMTRLCRLFVR